MRVDVHQETFEYVNVNNRNSLMHLSFVYHTRIHLEGNVKTKQR